MSITTAYFDSRGARDSLTYISISYTRQYNVFRSVSQLCGDRVNLPTAAPKYVYVYTSDLLPRLRGGEWGVGGIYIRVVGTLLIINGSTAERKTGHY